MKPKFHVGDVVTVRRDLSVKKIYGDLTLWKPMYEYSGLPLTIKYLSSSVVPHYGVIESPFIFSEEMLELYCDCEPVSIDISAVL